VDGKDYQVPFPFTGKIQALAALASRGKTGARPLETGFERALTYNDCLTGSQCRTGDLSAIEVKADDDRTSRRLLLWKDEWERGLEKDLQRELSLRCGRV
jgi:hypothetical protein